MILGYNGPLDEGERVLKPARTFGTPLADMIQPMPYCIRQTLLDEAFAGHGVQRYWKSGYAERLTDEIIDLPVEGAGGFLSPMSAIALFRIQGAPTRIAPDATAYALRQPLWDVNVVAQWLDGADSERNIAWARGLWARMEPLTGGSDSIKHFARDDRPERVRASYGSNSDRPGGAEAQVRPRQPVPAHPQHPTRVREARSGAAAPGNGRDSHNR